MAGGEHHIVPLSVFRKVLAVLVVLTVATVLFAPPVSGMDLGALSVLLAFVIAAVKATLVCMYFMHLKYDDQLYTIMLLSSVGFVVVLYIFSALDIYTRIFESSPL